MKNDKIAVFDLGGQYAHLIKKQIEKLGVGSYLVTDTTNPEEILPGTCGIILSGGPSSVYDKNSPQIPKTLFDCGLPVLGICYGHHLMAYQLGGEVARGNVREYGVSLLKITTEDSLFKDLKKNEKAWMSHGDSIIKLPKGFEILATTEDCKYAAIGNLDRKLFGVQFHPEVTHTINGRKIFHNFLQNICHCKLEENIPSKIEQLKKDIESEARDKRIFFFVSGGVDSTVAFTLCTKALGEERCHGICVDTGLMRKNEIEEIRKSFNDFGLSNIDYIDESKTFVDALKGVHSPETKRKIIGRTFIEIQNKYMISHKIDEGKWLLGQGTIYPDTIESGGTKHSSVIKTHHNRVDLVERLKKEGKLIEPISEFYKDEVRDLGKELGIPEEIVQKKPFPGPGLAIRCITSPVAHALIDRLDTVKKYLPKDCFKKEVKELSLRTVGVQGDSRTESNVIVIAGKIQFDKLETVSTNITNNIPDVNRVTYLLKSKKSLNDAKIVKREITYDRLDLLREADFKVRKYISKHKRNEDIWQFPVIIIPLQFTSGETIVLRPVSSING